MLMQINSFFAFKLINDGTVKKNLKLI